MSQCDYSPLSGSSTVSTSHCPYLPLCLCSQSPSFTVSMFTVPSSTMSMFTDPIFHCVYVHCPHLPLCVCSQSPSSTVCSQPHLPLSSSSIVSMFYCPHLPLCRYSTVPIVHGVYVYCPHLPQCLYSTAHIFHLSMFHHGHLHICVPSRSSSTLFPPLLFPLCLSVSLRFPVFLCSCLVILHRVYIPSLPSVLSCVCAPSWSSIFHCVILTICRAVSMFRRGHVYNHYVYVPRLPSALRCVCISLCSSLFHCVYVPSFSSVLRCVYVPSWSSLFHCVYVPSFSSVLRCVCVPSRSSMFHSAVSNHCHLSLYLCSNAVACLPLFQWPIVAIKFPLCLSSTAVIFLWVYVRLRWLNFSHRCIYTEPFSFVTLFRRAHFPLCL